MLSNVNVEAWSTVGTMMLRENGAPCAAIYTNNPTPTSMQPTAAAAAAAAPPTMQQTDAPVEQTAEKITTKDDHGDVMIRHFWERHRPCVFDTRIVDADAHSYRNKAPSSVLRQHERERKIGSTRKLALTAAETSHPSATQLMVWLAERLEMLSVDLDTS